jgi:radical SAM superfamily enzyme YgiQ (UPF0313 family)
MKCLLVDSHWQREEIGPRLALGRLAAAVHDIAEVKGIEFRLDEKDLSEVRRRPSRFWALEERFLRNVIQELERNPEVRLVGITGWSGSFPRMLRIAHCCKAANPDLTVVFGGPHVTLHEKHCPPEQSILNIHDSADFIVVGAGETPFRRLIEDLDRSELNICRNRRVIDANCEHYSAPTLRPKQNGDPLASSTFWSPFVREADKSSRLVFLVESARGCPHGCRFCDERDIWGRYRRFEIDRVLDEIERGIEQFGSRSFRFVDSTLTANPLLEDICRGIIQRDLGVAWSAFAHCSEITRRKAAMMAEAGCRCLLVGIESGVQSILDDMHKNSTRRMIESAIETLRVEGIKVRGSFIIGYPSETTRQALATVAFARSLELDAYSWHMYQSPFRRIWRDGEMDPPNFAHYELDTPADVTLQVLLREPSLIRDMHALPRLLTLDRTILPDPDRWPKQSVRLVSILQRAIDTTGDGGAYDLELLASEERSRRIGLESCIKGVSKHVLQGAQ